MNIIGFGFGFSLKKTTLFNQGDDKYRLWVLKLPFLHITILNKAASMHLLTAMHASFNDPQWLIDNHHAVRQAKRRAQLSNNKAHIRARADIREEYKERIDSLLLETTELHQKCRKQERDIEAYRRLINHQGAFND